MFVRTVLTVLTLLVASGSAHAQIDRFRDRIKRQVEDATKEVDRNLPRDGSRPAAPGSADSEKSLQAAPAESGDKHAAPGRDVTTIEPGRSEVRVVPLGTLPPDISPSQLMIAPGLRKVAYVGRVGSRQAVIVNGSRPSMRPVLGSIRFCPRGERVMYAIRRGSDQHVVVDNEVSCIQPH